MSPNFVENERGVLPSQLLLQAIKDGFVTRQTGDVPEESIQPASLDLHLGDVAYRLRCSFLPDSSTVEDKLSQYRMGAIDLTGPEGAILERNRPYLIPLVERVQLPPNLRGKANPKSSTGRLDIFTRVITDRNYMFDEIPANYQGSLYLEVVPRTFTIRVEAGLALNQLRLIAGSPSLTDDDIRALHLRDPILFDSGRPISSSAIAVRDGLFLSLALGKPGGGQSVGFRAKENSRLIDLAKVNSHPPSVFWEHVVSERGARIVLDPEDFYLLLSREGVRIPPEYAAEMTAFDPTSGELRTHYAGFFDPGFGHDIEGLRHGNRAALEVRAHDVPFAVEHGQNICKLSFEHMIEAPDKLYGSQIGSNYQNQEVALGKHFIGRRGSTVQGSLFEPEP